MLKNTVLTTIFFAIGLFSLAQNSTISGTVVDSETLKPIEGANVTIKGFDPVQSNSLGNFQMWNLPFGTYTLKVTEKNHSPFFQQVVLDSDYKYIRVRMGEIVQVNGVETSELDETDTNTATKVVKETIVIRDTVFVEKIVEVPSKASDTKNSNPTTNNKVTVDVTEELPVTISKVGDSTTKAPNKDLYIPIIDLDELDDNIDETGNNDNISAVLNASRDPFYNAAAFTLGAYRFRLRGLDNANGKLFMNNIEMNDLGIGRPSWTQWGGLNDVMRNRTDVYGLDKSNFTFGGLTGASNIDLRASKQRKQFKVSYALSNRSYMHRLMGTYSSGMMKGGWAVSVSGSWRYANNDNFSEIIRFNQEGTTYDAYSFFAAVDKKFGKNHLLSLVVFGASNKRGRNGIATQEAMDLAGSNFYNPNWGWQTEPNGKKYKRNARVGNVFIPTGILMHEWKLKNNSSLRTSIAYRKGINGGSAIDWRNAPDPRPDYYRNMPSYANIAIGQEASDRVSSLFQNNPDLLQLDWHRMYEANALSMATVEGANGGTDTAQYNIAKYILSERRYDPTIINFSTVYEKIINNQVKFDIGFNYANQQTHNYQLVKDLLGAEYHLNLNQFAERDFPGNDSIIQNDLDNPNRLVKVGEKYGYEYTNHIRKVGGWGQTELSFKKIDFFLANEITFTNFWREGHVRNGLFPDNSLGNSEIKKFVNFGIKSGITYKINGRNYLFGNASYGTRAPFIRNSMLSPRTRNDFIANLQSETLYSGEIGYLLKAPKIKARVEVYAAVIENQTSNRGVYFDQRRTFGTWVLTGINTRNIGIEAAATFEPFAGFTITPVVAWGDHTYTSRPNATLIEDNSNEPVFENKKVYFKGLHIANGPQAAYSLGLGYRTSSYWFFNLNFSYFDKIYIEPSPVRRIDEAIDNVPSDSQLWEDILSQTRMPGQFVMDASIGKSWMLNKTFKKLKKRQFLNFNLNVSNLTNNTKFVTGGFEQSRFDYTDRDLTKFQDRLFYSYGLNFFAQVSYRF